MAGLRGVGAAIALTVALGAGAGPASAQTIRPRPVPLDCRAATAELGAANTWFGVFAGRRHNGFDAIDTISVQACFQTERDCLNWLYWMQSDWPDFTFRIGCEKGAVPSGDPRWWSLKRPAG